MSPTLAARMADFLHTLKPAVSAMEIQSSIVSLFESVQELLERAAPTKVSQERRQQSKFNACTATRVTCWICMRLLEGRPESLSGAICIRKRYGLLRMPTSYV